MLAGQITSLAGLGLGSIADGNFAALVGVQVSTCTSAVAVRWNRLLVNVVHERTALGRKTRDGDREFDASAIFGGHGVERSSQSRALLLRESCDVHLTDSVASDSWGGSYSRGLGIGESGRSQSDELIAHLEVEVCVVFREEVASCGG